MINVMKGQKQLDTYTIEHIKLPAKLLDYLLRSNKSNINQPHKCTSILHLHMVFKYTCINMNKI